MVSKSKILIFFGFLLYPVYALPWIIKHMIKNEYFGYFLISLFMAYLAFLMIPYELMDLARHYEVFTDVSKMNFDDLINYRRGVEYLFNLYMWLVHQAGLNKEFVPFSFIFMIYLLYFLALKMVIDFTEKSGYSKYNKKIFTIGILLFFLYGEIRFIAATSGLRNDLAFSFFVYAITFFLIYKKIVLPIILIILSIAIHFSVFPLALLFLISRLYKFKKTIRLLFIVSFLLMVSGVTEDIFYYIMEQLKPFLMEQGLYFRSYFERGGVYGSGFFVDKNLNTIILEKVIKPSSFYLAGIYMIFTKKLACKKIQNFIYLVFIFISLISISRTLMDRYSYFLSIFFVIIFVFELQYKAMNKFRQIFIVSLSLSILLMYAGEMMRWKKLYAVSWSKIFIVPAPIMMLNEVDKKEYIIR
jgi:hypothetical protein